MNSSPILAADEISYIYPGSSKKVVDRAQCILYTGEITALVGPTASGKSTFGRLLKGLIEPLSGRINYSTGDSVQKNVLSRERLTLVGWAGAHPEIQIFSSTVGEEIAFGLLNQGCDHPSVDWKIRSTMTSIGLDPDLFIGCYPHFLSGGERKRVALASIIAMDYVFYIFDEPTAGLDDPGRRDLMKALISLKENGKGVLLITHDMDFLKGSIDRLWLMQDGKLLTDADISILDS